jgi:hypothetical protein
MARVIKIVIAEALKNEILKKFKQESKKIFKQMYSLKDNPKKGKLIGNVGGIYIKEIKYKSFRFYFVTDGFKLKILGEENLIDILIKFIKMSDKKYQQETIEEIKKILFNVGSRIF